MYISKGGYVSFIHQRMCFPLTFTNYPPNISLHYSVKDLHADIVNPSTADIATSRMTSKSPAPSCSKNSRDDMKSPANGLEEHRIRRKLPAPPPGGGGDEEKETLRKHLKEVQNNTRARSRNDKVPPPPPYVKKTPSKRYNYRLLPWGVCIGVTSCVTRNRNDIINDMLGVIISNRLYNIYYLDNFPSVIKFCEYLIYIILNILLLVLFISMLVANKS